jgi:enoyl-CoA hydratase/carnithine racemase
MTVPDYKYVLYDVSDGIASITMNRPEKLNAHNLQMYNEVISAFELAGKDTDVRVITVAGNGRAFCVGRDFTYSAELQQQESVSAWRRAFKGFTRYTLLNEKMVIALVQGYALGGGGSMALAADITIATPDAKFGYPETRHGIASKTMLWAWTLGSKRAKEIVATGRHISVAEAASMRLVNRTVAIEDLNHEGRRLAEAVAAMPYGLPETVKRQVNYANRDMIRASYDNRKLEADTAAWDIAGVEPSEWLRGLRILRGEAVRTGMPSSGDVP